MRKLFLLVVLLASIQLINAQVQSDNKQIWFNSDDNSTTKWKVGNSGDATDNFIIYDSKNDSSVGNGARLLIHEQTGNVGIGTVSPKAKLEAKGSILANKGFFNKDLSVVPVDGILNSESLLLGAGLDKVNTPLFAFHDMAATATVKPRVLFYIEDKADQRRLYLDAREGGRTYFSLNDVTEQSEFFSIYDVGNDKEDTYINFPKKNSYLVLGGKETWPNVIKHKLWVKDGSAMIEGNIITNSKIGVGVKPTDIPTDYKLAVDGKIISEEVKVKLRTGTTWPDYVFVKDYNLPTLKEVEKHIKENGHLKNIPNAKNVSENGISLGEMNAKLLEKIEELTLYTIEQQKQIDENKALKKRLIALEKRVEKLNKK